MQYPGVFPQKLMFNSHPLRLLHALTSTFYSRFNLLLLSQPQVMLHHKQGHVGSSKSRKKDPKMQDFDYFLVLDFEATCDNDPKFAPRPQEIIEFPVLKINSRTFETESTFHTYVQPTVHKSLTPFCTELTGIIQDMVDDQPPLSEVLQNFDKWMLENSLLEPGVKSIFVTCGDWDLRTMLPGQCKHFNLEKKPYFSNWINIKKSFANHTSVWPKNGLPIMLETLRLPFLGRHHSGIDDCKNIASILVELTKKGYIFTKSDVQH